MNLIKYQGINLPGNVQFDAQGLISQGNEEMERIEAAKEEGSWKASSTSIENTIEVIDNSEEKVDENIWTNVGSSSSYTITEKDTGKNIRATVSYEDNSGFLDLS